MKPTLLNLKRGRRVIRRAVFVLQHPQFQDMRMLSQELFTPKPKWLTDTFVLLHRNECRKSGDLYRLAGRVVEQLYDKCDFISLEKQGAFLSRNSLRPFDTEVTIFEIIVAEEFSALLNIVPDEFYIAPMSQVAETLRSGTRAEALPKYA